MTNIYFYLFLICYFLTDLFFKMKFTFFNPDWLQSDKYKFWLLENNDDKRSFGCSVRSLELGKMGKQALEKHMRTKKHGERLKRISSAGPMSHMKVWGKSGSSGKTFFNEEYIIFLTSSFYGGSIFLDIIIL